MYTHILSAAVIVFSALSVQPAGADDTVAVLNTLRAQAETHKRVAFDTNMDINMMGQKVTATGEMAFASPRLSATMNISMGDSMSMTMRTVMDEQYVYSYSSMLNMVTKIDISRVREAAPDLPLDTVNSPAGVFFSWDTEMLEHIGSEDLDGAATEHFIIRDMEKLDVNKLSPAAGMLPMIGAGSTVEVWVDSENGMPRLMAIKDSQGETVMDRRYSNFRFGTDVPEAALTFILPEGVPVVDWTEQAIKTLQSKSESGGAAPQTPGTTPAE